MEKKELLEKVAPCSLMCHTCGAYEQGVICESAKKLLKYTEGALAFYEKHVPDGAERYRVFQEELEKAGAGACSGCRGGGNRRCSIEGCFILACTKERGVDFCGECGAFPCGRTKDLFEEEVYSQWLEGNADIQKMGIEEYFRRNSAKPHYSAYQKND